MQNNPQVPRIILYQSHKIELKSGKQYFVITDKAGTPHSISEKRQELWPVFKNARDAEPFLLLYETYNGVQYIAGAKPITDDLLKQAIQDMGLKMADAQTEERNRSTALSYAKDLAVAKIINLPQLLTQAETNYQFIKGVKPQ